MSGWTVALLILYAWGSGVWVGWRMHRNLRGERALVTEEERRGR